MEAPQMFSRKLPAQTLLSGFAYNPHCNKPWLTPLTYFPDLVSSTGGFVPEVALEPRTQIIRSLCHLLLQSDYVIGICHRINAVTISKHGFHPLKPLGQSLTTPSVPPEEKVLPFHEVMIGALPNIACRSLLEPFPSPYKPPDKELAIASPLVALALQDPYSPYYLALDHLRPWRTLHYL
ncbi:hypothetical protein Tco_0294824 [Tanacetum coccineum]